MHEENRFYSPSGNDSKQPCLQELLDDLNCLTLYGGIRQEPVVSALSDLWERQNAAPNDPETARRRHAFVALLARRGEDMGVKGDVLKECILQALINDENVFSLACERGDITAGSTLSLMAEKDINKMGRILNSGLYSIFDADMAELLSQYTPIKEKRALSDNIDSSPDRIFSSLTGYYKSMGCGAMGRSPMFRFDLKDAKLYPVKNPDKSTFDDIIGYEYQKQVLKDNTEAFLAGLPAANTLLAGARGTGKSSLVKALSWAYFDQGLRIIEITKEQILQLNELMEIVATRGKRFLLFVDDLSFEDFETEYKHLKSLLEGGTQTRPQNVLFYATSNRRHIIQEKWRDKHTNPEDEEIHTSDMMNEKLSLSDRFGLTITFPKPSPGEYLDIVDGIAKRRGICMDREELNQQALSWELNQKGLSGRTAKQFIDSLSAAGKYSNRTQKQA